ncbi:MAG: DNA internalization-related competence protein ComEC/Rec2 [Lachnospiraceae bacterium]|nr:DNA internalization-related competence protein ComEC/Rec2 [Lachnospiraceae bacterium]
MSMKRPLCAFCLAVSLAVCMISPLVKKNIRSYEEISERTLTFTGIVYDIEPVQTDLQNSLLIYMKNVSLYENGQDRKFFSGRNIRLIAYKDLEDSDLDPDHQGFIHIGQRIRIKGKLHSFASATNEGMFDSLVYYNSLGISFSLRDVRIIDSGTSYDHLRDRLCRIRLNASKILRDTLAPEEGSVMCTMLLGYKKAVEEELKSLYRRNGIAHILCISGLHISLLGIGLFRLLKRTPIGIRAAAVTSFLIVFLYVLMTGMGASSLRALFMFTVSMIAVLIKRTPDMLTSMSVICMFLLLSNPLFIYNAGFCFSFGCVIGIAVLMPTLSSERVSENGRKVPAPIKVILGPLTIVVIGFPIYLFFYFQFPVYSFALNFLVIPVMGILVTAGFLLIVTEPFFPAVSSVIGLLITGILEQFKKLSEAADALPFHFYTPGKPALWQVIVYVLILASIYAYRKKTTLYVRWSISLVAVFILILRSNYGCTLDFLDVGQGDGMFLRYSKMPVTVGGFSGDFTCLIDGGSSSVSKVGKYRIIPYLKSRGCDEVDIVILSHLDSDHTSGIKELLKDGPLEGIIVKALCVPYPAADHDRIKYEEIAALCKTAGVQLVELSEGNTLSPDKGLKMIVESPFDDVAYTDPNEMSVVISLYCNGQSLLLTGDIGGNAEKILAGRMSADRPYTLLKCAHHGSKTSSSNEFLNKTSPAVTVISVGKGNSYGLPADETLKRLKDRNIRIYRTDENGMIRARIKKVGICIRSFTD